jgi:sugar phosphate permease
MSALPLILMASQKKGYPMEFVIFGAIIGILGLLWVILSLHDDPLEEGIRQAQAWDRQQKALARAVGK